MLFIGKLDNWEGMKAGIPSSVHSISFPAYYDGCPADGSFVICGAISKVA